MLLCRKGQKLKRVNCPEKLSPNKVELTAMSNVSGCGVSLTPCLSRAVEVESKLLTTV